MSIHSIESVILAVGALLGTVACLPPLAFAAENDFFAMDNGIRDVKKLSDKAELLSTLGYDGITWRPGGTAEALRAMTARGVKIHAFKISLDVSRKEKATAFPVQELEALKSTGAIVWVTLQRKGGDDADAVRELKRLNALAKPLGLRIAIYPHINCHVETLEGALRVANLVADENVGVSLTLCHQLKMQGVQDLAPLLKEALPKLFIVQVSGAETGNTRKMGWDKLIQPLGQGSYDIKGLFQILKDLDYTGPVGVIGFGIKQPAKQHLKQSISFWKKSGNGSASGR